MITKVELEELLSHCHECVHHGEVDEELKEPITKLRGLGRDSYFCMHIVDKFSLSKLIQLYLDLEFDNKTDLLLISLLATISNIILSNREIKNAVLPGQLDALIDKSLELTDYLDTKHNYKESLVSVLLPLIRLIYLITVEKVLVSKLSDESLQRILKLLERQFKLLGEQDDTDLNVNSLILIDLIKISYSILNFNKVYYTDNSISINLKLIINNKKLPIEVLNQYANYISFLPISSLKPHSEDLISIIDLYINQLQIHVEQGRRLHAISFLNFFNHLAELSESLYCDGDKSLFEALLVKFIPGDDNTTPPIYTKLMKTLLNGNSSSVFSFAGGDNEQMFKDLTLDFYFKIMGNNIDRFVNEMGLLLSMDFVKAKLGHNKKTYAQGEFDIVRENTSLYPLHYNVVEENKKDHELLPEMTEEEKEEELDKLIKTLDKMKKNGMIKMVSNPLDAIENS